MDTTVVRRRVPVAGPIENRRRGGKKNTLFEVHGVKFSLPENSTFAKIIAGADRAIVLYEESIESPLLRVIEVIPSYTWQQVLKMNEMYSPE